MNRRIKISIIKDIISIQSNKGKLNNFTHKSCFNNKSCNDIFCIHILIENDILTDIKYFGDGCSLSTVSIDLLCSEVKGQRLSEAKEIVINFEKFAAQKYTKEKWPYSKEFLVFEDMSDFPNRIDCILSGIILLKRMIIHL